MDFSANKIKEDKVKIKIDSLDENLLLYKEALEIVKKLNIEKVYDIGCLDGKQSNLFLEEGINYVGINKFRRSFYNEDRLIYIIGKYPFKIGAKENDLALLIFKPVSYFSADLFKKQLMALKRDFRHILFYIKNKEAINEIRNFFPRAIFADNGFIYVSI